MSLSSCDTVRIVVVIFLPLTPCFLLNRLDQVVRVVRDGQTKRAPIERLADHLTGYFVPVVTLLAILTWVIWLGLGLGGALPSDYLDKPTGGWRKYLLVFITSILLTIACA